jgi:general stress protein 26
MTLAHHTDDSAPDAVEHVLELLHGFDTAMLVTHTTDGSLHARPMAVAEVESGGTLWFVTDVTSPKMGDIGAEPDILLAFQDSRRYLTVNGEADVVRSPEKIRELWKESFKLWFEGPEDPRLVLLKVTPEDAEYWDTSGARGLKFAFRAAKAYLTGQPAKKEDDPAVHGKIGR